MVSPTFGDYRQTRHFGSLDGVRFLCIGAVIWHHAPMDPQGLLLSRGFVGVDFFFVISGFLITTLLLREHDRTGRISLAGFYRRRILRILPLYALVVSLVAGGYILVKGETEWLRLLPFYALFLSNYLTEHIPTLSITWSLSVEEQYYVLWPLLLIVTPRRLMPLVLGGLVALNLAAITGALRPLGIVPIEAGPLLLKMFPATFTPILLGSAAALALNDPRGFRFLARLLGGRWSCWPLFLAVPVVLALLPEDLRGWPNLILHLLMTAALISVVIREDHAMRPLLAFAPVARIGQISYGIYLYHLLALHAVTAAGIENRWAVLVVYAILSIVVAEISFRTFEAWFMRLRDRPLGKVGRPAVA